MLMLEFIIAVILVICLASFSIINLHNILVVHKRREPARVYAEIERPSELIVSVAGIGTFVYFLEMFAYVFLVFAGFISWFYALPFLFQFLLSPYLQIMGLFLTIVGYSFFSWSVIARGQYAVSWNMPKDQKLVTWGPYRYVRHPSYLGYFLMFFGFFSIMQNVFTLFPFFAISGYVRVAFDEEKLLLERFGEEYLNYQKRTGRFFPKF